MDNESMKAFKNERDDEADEIQSYHFRSVLQPWVMQKLTLMQQSVLVTATRAPDGLKKLHPVKMLCRWLRRCYMVSAFDKCILNDPYDPRGGSFMGPITPKQATAWNAKTETWGNIDGLEYAANQYIETGDEIPLHFHFHLSQAAEILGYKHPVEKTRNWWLAFYHRLCAFGHLNPETEAQMDRRLADVKEQWEEREA